MNGQAIVVCAPATLADIALGAAVAFGMMLAVAAVAAWYFRAWRP